jgi:hypothetical protein
MKDRSAGGLAGDGDGAGAARPESCCSSPCPANIHPNIVIEFSSFGSINIFFRCLCVNSAPLFSRGVRARTRGPCRGFLHSRPETILWTEELATTVFSLLDLVLLQ